MLSVAAANVQESKKLNRLSKSVVLKLFEIAYHLMFF